MKENTKYIFLTILVIISTLILIFQKDNKSEADFCLKQSANSSSGTYWEYELSTDKIIKETNYYETRFPLNFTGYKQNWEFDIIGRGDVTVYWKAYDGGSYDEKNCYSVTYSFD